MKSPWLGLLGGTILTCAIQSSAATIAIVQQMYGAGAIGLNIALPFFIWIKYWKQQLQLFLPLLVDLFPLKEQPSSTFYLTSLVLFYL